MTEWNRLRGKRVRVSASGVAYEGVVVEMGENCLVLRSASGFREIPWEQIAQVAEEAAEGGAP
jgi:hypothetical protein